MNKAVIYLRTSTTEQHPEIQEQECRNFAISRGYEIEKVYLEQLSGYKQIERPMYEDIKQKAHKGEINAVIVWALDRWVRNRDTLLDDVITLRNCNCKLHSVKESWLEAVNIDGALGKTIQEFLLGLIGSIGEMESQRKSERVKLAYSRRTKDWGRPKHNLDSQIINLKSIGKSYREIQKEVYIWDKNNHKKYISLGYISNVIQQHDKNKKAN